MQKSPVFDQKLADDYRKRGYWVPFPGPQSLALAISTDRRYREILFGGARGGAKTSASIAILSRRIRDQRAKQLVIRRNAEDLSDFEDRAQQAYVVLGIKLRRHPMVLTGKNTGRILGGHLKDDDAYTKYQGHEYCRINIEELTQIPREDLYLKLISSCRSKHHDLFPQVFNTANPGGIGMKWVKQRFVTPDLSKTHVIKHVYDWVDVYGKPRQTKWQTIIDKETGLWRAYIPSTIDDNPALLENDPDYVKQLDALKSSNPDLYRAWRLGDWNIQFGAVFDEFREYKHTFQRFDAWDITQDDFNNSFRIAGMDWGYNDECVILWATFDTITEKQERAFIYREKHNNHKNPRWWAEHFRNIQEVDPVQVLALPHDAYYHLGGNKPIYEVFKEALDTLPPDKRPKFIRADKLMRDVKMSAVNSLHDMLADQADGKPGILIHSSANYLIDTLPTIIYAKDSGGEELDKDNEDHALDALFYTLLTANKVRGKIINPAKLKVKPAQSFVNTGQVTAKELGIETDKLVKNAIRR